MHAIFLTVNHAWRLRFGTRAQPYLWAGALTYCCVLAGSVVFRAPSLPVAGTVFAAMLGAHGIRFIQPDPRQTMEIARLAALYAIVWLAPNTQQIVCSYQPVREAMHLAPSRLVWHPNLPWAAALGLAACLGLLSLGGSSEFLYFRF
jgi:alginate O-acetyltransferase complex protein AlgI